MAVTTQEGRKQTQFVSSTPRRRNSKKSRANKSSGSIVASSFKASVMGGFGILLLLLIGLIPIWYLAFLVIPGYLVVWLSTGLLAGVLAGDQIKSTHQGGKVGWMAGFWAGVFGGLVAMILAAAGALMVDFGQGVVSQFPPEQLETLVSFGLTPNVIALMGRVFGALIVYGLVGSLISGLFSSIGGMIYPKLALVNSEKSYRTSA
jgi:hypothetical protein